MSSRLQLDVRNLSLRRRHLVNGYKVNAGIDVYAGKTVLSMREWLECEVLQNKRYINTLTFTFTFTFYSVSAVKVCLYREKYLHISFWRAFSLYLTSAADLNSLVLLPGGLLWMPY